MAILQERAIPLIGGLVAKVVQEDSEGRALLDKKGIWLLMPSIIGWLPASLVSSARLLSEPLKATWGGAFWADYRGRPVPASTFEEAWAQANEALEALGLRSAVRGKTLLEQLLEDA